MSGEPQETQITAAAVTQLLDKTPSRGELERVLSASKKQVAQQDLFQKVNSGHARKAELVALAIEIREQEVVARLLFERDIQRLKQRYL